MPPSAPQLSGWSKLPPSPIGNLSDANAVWSGTELVVFDGFSGAGPPATEALLPARAPSHRPAASTIPRTAASTIPTCIPNGYSVDYRGPEHAAAQVLVSAVFRLRQAVGAGSAALGRLEPTAW
ncbi:MAG: hypothetical protein ACYCO3_16075 [Mycobacteriales bacterium]